MSVPQLQGSERSYIFFVIIVISSGQVQLQVQPITVAINRSRRSQLFMDLLQDLTLSKIRLPDKSRQIRK